MKKSLGRRHRPLSLTLVVFVILSVAGESEAAPIAELKMQQAPPGPPPVEETVEQFASPSGASVPSGGSSIYLIGEPTDEEHLLLELINRAREDANAEAQRFVDIVNNNEDPEIVSVIDFFMVNLNTMVSQFATLDQSTQPLSMNTLLVDAARFHSNDMFTNAFQDHTGSDGRGTFDRIDDFGYSSLGTRAENIFAFGASVEQGHAGLDIDWGQSATGQSIDGMQDPPGHRTSIHNAGFREVGLGIVVGTNTVGGSTVGPFVITQDFGSQPGSGPFITGAAFYDINGNEFYDIGEGLGGIAVDVSGAAFSAVTAQSGGFSVPVAGNGTYTVTFSGPNLAEEMGTVEVANDENAGIDYLPAYSAPTVSPPAEVFVNFANGFTFTTVGGSTGYRLRQALLANEDFSENAESDADVTIEPVDPGYSIIQGSVVPPGGGSNAFHLANPDFTDTTITLDASILIEASSQLEFSSRLGVATTNQLHGSRLPRTREHHGRTYSHRPVLLSRARRALFSDRCR